MPGEKTVTEEAPKVLPTEETKVDPILTKEDVEANKVKEAEVAAAAKKEAEEKAKTDDAEEAKKPDEKSENEDENKPKEDPKLDTETWGSSEDEVVNGVLLELQESGITPDDAKALLFDPVLNGKPDDIDIDALTEKVGAARAKIIMTGVRDFVKRTREQSDAAVAEVETTVGGNDNWKKIGAWATENLPAKDIDTYKDLINAGGARARFAASELLKAYNGDPANTTLGGKQLSGDNIAGATSEAISSKEYYSRMEKANRDGADSTTIAEIKAARARGRARNIA